MEEDAGSGLRALRGGISLGLGVLALRDVRVLETAGLMTFRHRAPVSAAEDPAAFADTLTLMTILGVALVAIGLLELVRAARTPRR